MIISVVLSFRNEEKVIPELIKRLRAALSDNCSGHELIFVNDASTDGSLEVLKSEAVGNRDIKIINMSRTFGKENCVIAGMKYAKGDAVIYMDSDLQDPPELIPELIEKWQSGAEIVYTTQSSRKGENLIKKLVTLIAYRVLKFFSGNSFPLDSGDFKLLSRRAVDHLLNLDEKNTYIRGMITWMGFNQEQVMFDRQERHAGETHFPLCGGAPASAFIAAITSFSFVPIYVIFLTGIVLTLISLVLFAGLLVMHFSHTVFPEGYILLNTLALLAGTVLLAAGVNGIYLAAIYMEVRKRPAFIVESTIGFEDNNSADNA